MTQFLAALGAWFKSMFSTTKRAATTAGTAAILAAAAALLAFAKVCHKETLSPLF